MEATMKLASFSLNAPLASTALGKARTTPSCSLNYMGFPSRTAQLSTRCHATTQSSTVADCGDVFKIFADDSTGVVCYKNELGEMVCEGLDEGPHFYPQLGFKDGPSSMYVADNQAAQILPIFDQSMYEI
ncbi:hypothetical protein GOP47_0022505 [Adiantum capillus-veneris]|uniref:Uncharacterized protein n=1 Tax=Adiantum capillus-veneris TaxID=13818 RepID=A0A9D4U7V5_ADICA|nr:hypothetical protein GOP47_0022505 [Adiantum capillus-veneris]